MAAFKTTIDKLRKELNQRYATLDTALAGTRLTVEEAKQYCGAKDNVLLRHDSMAIRLAINDFKSILAEAARVK